MADREISPQLHTKIMTAIVTRKQIGRAVDQAQLLKLRRDGYPIEHIAGVMKMSPIAALAAINDALKELQGDSREYAAQIREIELQRLDLATKALMPAVEKGSHEDIDMLLKVQKRRSSYLGLDAATNANVNNTVTIRRVVDGPPGVLHSIDPVTGEIVLYGPGDRTNYNDPLVTDALVIDTKPAPRSPLMEDRTPTPEGAIPGRILDPDPPAPGTARDLERRRQ